MLKIKNITTGNETNVTRKEAAKFIGKKVAQTAVLGVAESTLAGMSTHAIMSATRKIADKATTQKSSTAIYIAGAVASCVTAAGIYASIENLFEEKEREVLCICEDEEDDLIDEEDA